MENEEKQVQVDAAVTEEVKKESGKQKCGCDARTFLIAFLTSLIMILAYHGLMVWYNNCCKKSCPVKPVCSRECPPEFAGKRHHFEGKRNFEGKRKFKRPRCQEESCQNPRHRHGKKVIPAVPETEKAE